MRRLVHTLGLDLIELVEQVGARVRNRIVPVLGRRGARRAAKRLVERLKEFPQILDLLDAREGQAALPPNHRLVRRAAGHLQQVATSFTRLRVGMQVPRPHAPAQRQDAVRQSQEQRR